MSLSGVLSELTLRELLQLFALSKKSGMLEIYSEENVAWLGLRNGGIERIAMANGGPDAKETLAGAGLEGSSDEPAVQACLREAAQAAIAEVFGWARGEFSFDSRAGDSEYAPGPDGIVLRVPIVLGELPESEPPPSTPPAEEPVSESPLEDDDSVDTPREVLPERSPLQAVIVVDPELSLLEPIKDGLRTRVARVHLFQDAAEAGVRLKQYLADGEFPALVISQEARDSSEPKGQRGWRRFVRRVWSISPKVRVVLLATRSDLKDPGGAQVLDRPDVQRATDETLASFVEELAEKLGTSS